MHRLLSFLSALIFICTIASAQNKTKEIPVNGVSGSAIGTKNMTVEQVEQLAINKAKEEALRKAGIEEQINSFTDYFMAESQNKMEELYTSEILSNIRGSVKDVEVITRNSNIENGLVNASVTINCTVIKYNTERDKMFTAELEGMKIYYNNGDFLTFDLTPSQDAFLRVFMFTANEAFVLFPNDYEKSFELKANTKYHFPISVDYELNSGGTKKESNRMIVVLLKKDYPYHGEITYPDITRWIFEIAPDERLIQSKTFDVVMQK